MNKHINREGQQATNIFDNRSLENDYRTLIPLLSSGMRVLDVGCGTGAISQGIARRVGSSGYVVGIDNTARFIEGGNETYQDVENLALIHADLFSYQPQEKFDLIVSARTLQWLSNPKEALLRLKGFLKPGGWLSVLDYNHEALEWKPLPPQSMQEFYQTFLRWRADAGMNNRIGEDLADYFQETGFHSVEVYDSNEVYAKSADNFKSRVGIWAKVAGSTQMVEEGYISEADRLLAIEEYTEWVDREAESMIMHLKEVRGRI
jgi:ubiquinone/menaquinone biosynthesis C-methylase UbiE